MARVDLEVAPPVATVSREFLESVARDPIVVDWLISVSENMRTREDYLDWLARFLQWTSWSPSRIFEIKREAMKQGEPSSEVEGQIKRFHESMRRMGYSGKYRAKAIAAVFSFIGSKGYTVKRRLVRLDLAGKLEIRVPTREEVEFFIQYASTLEKKLCYTLMTESPCRPRVFTALRWSWLESEWWTKNIVHVNLPKQFRPSNQGGPRKFEPICFIGPKGISMLKQLRDAKIKAGGPPLETDHILPFTQDAMSVAVRRDYEDLVKLGLVRASRKDEKCEATEQSITPKSWRKYQFNIIDSLTEISTEWRRMLKGRDLQTERYYSRENVDALRKIYGEKIYPQLWSGPSSPQNQEEVRSLREQVTNQGAEIEELRQLVRQLATDQKGGDREK